jgi:N-methylhydantoinase B
VLDDELKRLVLANVRNADEAWGTILAQISSLATAEERIHGLIGRYDLATFKAATDAYLDYARKRFLAALRNLPDGVWSAEDFLDDDGAGSGPLRIALTVHKSGHSLSVDFDGTDPQGRGPANTSFVNTRSAVLVAALSIVDPDLPLNSGWFDLVEVTAPRGSVVNPEYPAPMFHGTGAPLPRIFDLVLRALAPAVPERVTAATYGTGTVVVLYFADPQTGEERSWMHYTGGGGGARATHDGLDGVWWPLANCKLDSVEVLEQRFPLLFESEGWQRPSAGAGRQRGGLGIERRLRLLADARASALNDRHRIAPWGLFGGGDGAP